jgi:hypothetical protein
MKPSVLFLSFIFFCNTSAQITFERYYETLNDNRSNTVLQTSDNHFVMVGHAVTRTGPSVMDVLLMNIAPDGDLIWTKTIGVLDDDEQIYDMQPTADGGYIPCGQYDEGFTDIYYYLLKINANGDSLWRWCVLLSIAGW